MTNTQNDSNQMKKFREIIVLVWNVHDNILELSNMHTLRILYVCRVKR